LKEAKVVILDEATSALDSESERFVQEAIDNLTHEKTTIIIAHRLSTIENVDKIVVLERGKIAEMGTHSELLANGGIYSKMVALQKGGEFFSD
jgi:ABC-type multidrug transport system fused ATPase/permease subunit